MCVVAELWVRQFSAKSELLVFTNIKQNVHYISLHKFCIEIVMPPACFDPLWIIFREEPHQSVVDNARIKIKERQQCIMYPDILRSLVEREMRSIFHVQLQPPLPYQGLNTSVGMATRYGLDVPGIESRWGRDIPHPSMGPTQPPIQRVPGLSRG